MRVALLGYGTGGACFHAPLIEAVEGLELAAIVTRDPGRRARAAARHPGAALLDGPGQVWHGGYDLAVVTVPNRLHVPLARAALTAGLAVVVDKPVAATSADARALAEHARAAGRPVFPFHNRRLDGDFRTVADLVAAGRLGRVLRMESRFERWRPEPKPGWKESGDPADAGGIHYDLGSHLVDQALVLLGPARQVYAEIATRRPGALVPDEMLVSLLHDGGARSHLWASAVAADLGPRFRVLGDRAAYTTWGMDVQEEALRAGGGPRDLGWGQVPAGRYGRLGTPGDTVAVPTLPGAYQDFYAAVRDTLAHGAPPPVSMADAIAGLRVIEAAQESAAQGRVVAPAGPG